LYCYTLCLFCLFSRYYGDDKKEGKDSDEKAKLAVFLSKIEERKKQKEAIEKAKFNNVSPDLKSHVGEHADDIGTSVTSFEGEDDKNKKRHKNIDFIDDERMGEKEATDVSDKGDSTEKKKKKKKKKKYKRKWREICDSEESEGDAGKTKIVKSVEKVEGFTVLGTDKFRKKQKVCIHQRL